MDALTPLTASSSTPTAPQAPHAPPAPLRAPGTPAPAAQVVHLPVDSLPPLPAAVQRTQLDPAPPALISREEMLNLLSLAV